MSNDLAVVQNYTQEQVDLIKRTVAKGATDDELSMFMAVAKRARLDPFLKQIHFVKRKQKTDDGRWVEVGAIQVAIDGYRAIAERTGTLAGIDDAIFDREDQPHPGKATVSVYRVVAGQRVPFTASARWSEYAATYKDGNPQPMWKKMPYLMLAKCAESLALRKAFPNDLSGLYTNEEMAQADDGEVVEHLPAPVEPEVLQGYIDRINEAEDVEALRGITGAGLKFYKERGDAVSMEAIRQSGKARAAMLTAKEPSHQPNTRLTKPPEITEDGEVVG